MAIDLGKRKIKPQNLTVDAVRKSIFHNIDEFDEYIYLIEEVLDNKEKKFVDRLKLEAENHEYYNFDEISEFFIDDWNQIGAVFPTIFRKSIFLSLFSLFEFEINNVCHKLSSLNTQIKSFKPQTPYTLTAKNFLDTVITKKSHIAETAWNQIDIYRCIRNVIVHNGSRFYDDTQNYERIKDFIEEHTGENFIEVTKSGYMFYSKEFILFFIDNIRIYFNEVFQLIESQYQ